MKTIHIKKKNLASNHKLIHALYKKILKHDHGFHYLIEPELIIRTGSLFTERVVCEYLHKKKIEYDTYDYPVSKKGYGEDKKSVMTKYSKEMLVILHWLSILSLKANYKDYLKLFERITHCALNMNFYEWNEEVTILTKLAFKRSSLIVESDEKRFLERKI